MKVLVTAGSKHGSTAQIAATIAESLRKKGVDARLMPIEEVRDLDGFDGAVIGSGVYGGRWLRPARRLIDVHQSDLRDLKVWLFSSVPLGHPFRAHESEPEIARLTGLVGAVDHRIFAGGMDQELSSFAAQSVVPSLDATAGEFRDFEAVRGWAESISDTLQRAAATYKEPRITNRSKMGTLASK